MEIQIEQWIIKWFSKNANQGEREIKKKVAANYFEEGWIDSFKFVTFIMDMEEEFNIRFLNDEFQNRKFSTVKGLVVIIKNKLNG